jgi:hypothetical protein
MDGNSDPSGSSIAVVARQRALPPLVEAAAFSEREGVCRYDQSAQERFP